MSRPTSPIGDSSSTRSPNYFYDLGDPEITLTSPLSPPLPIPPPPSRSYTDDLNKKSVPVDATPVIRLLAPTPEATSPMVLFRPQRAGFPDEDEEEPFPSFFYPTLPATQFDGVAGASKDNGGASSPSGFQSPMPWTDELTRQRRRYRRPSYVQSVFEEDTSSSSSSDSSSSSSPSDDDNAVDIAQRASGTTEDDHSSGATTEKVGFGGDDETDGDSAVPNVISSKARDITRFRFPGATVARR